jgi:regulator of protease activity HflC (stomatin/prohibitin superfamily)
MEVKMALTGIFAMAALGICSLVGLGAVLGSFYTVREKSEALITRFGKYKRTGEPGLRLKWPFIESVHARVPLGLQQFEDHLEIKTVDDMFVGLPVAIQYTVTDTKKHIFGVEGDPRHQVMQLINDEIRSEVSGMDSQELYDNRERINNKVVEGVARKMDDYGVDIKRIVISEPSFPEEVKLAYNDVRASERRLEAGRNEAEENKQRIIKESEGRREAAANSGKGIAEQREAILSNYADSYDMLVKRGISPEAAERQILMAMQYDTMREIGEHGNMIVTSGDVQNGIAGMQTLGHTLQAANDRDRAHARRPAPAPVAAPAGPAAP